MRIRPLSRSAATRLSILTTLGLVAFGAVTVAEAAPAPFTATVTPTSATAGATLPVVTLQFTAQSTISGATITASVPGGWSPIQTSNPTLFGYAAVSSPSTGGCTTPGTVAAISAGAAAQISGITCVSGQSLLLTLSREGVQTHVGTASFPVSAQSSPTAKASKISSPTVDVIAGPTSKLAITPNPVIGTAGKPVTLTVTAQDMFNNVTAGYVGTVHLLSTVDPSATFSPSPYTFTAKDAGVHKFSATFFKAGNDLPFVADNVQTAINGHGQAAISPATTSQLVVTPASASTPAGSPLNVQVTAADTYGNTTPSYAGTVHFTSNDAAAALPSDYTYVASDNGVHSFSATLNTVGSRSVTATDSHHSSITGSAPVAVNPSGPTAFVVTYPTSTTAGQPQDLTVTATDFAGDPTSYTGTVRVTSSDPHAQLPLDYAFTAADNGTHTFGNVALNTAGTQTITVTDTTSPALTGASSGIQVAPASTAMLTITGYPTTTSAGSPHPLTVTAEDAFGNVTPAYAGTVHFTSSDVRADLPGDYAFTASDAGTHVFTATLKSPGSQSITATDNADSTITGEFGTTVVPGPTTTFLVTGLPSTMTAGDTEAVTATAIDSVGNVTPYTGTVHLTSSDPHATLPSDYSFSVADSGQHTFTGIVLTTAGSQSVTATDAASPSITGTQGTRVNPAATSNFDVAYPTATVAGAMHDLVMTARDAYGNTTPSYVGSVHFSSTDGQAVVPGDTQFTAADNGVHTFPNVAFETAGPQTISATDVVDHTVAGSTGSVSVSPAATSVLVVSGYPSPGTAGDAHNVTVVAKDAYGNTTPAYVGTAHFSSTDAQAALPADYAFTAADAGQRSFAVTLRTAAVQSITAADTNTSSIVGSETGINVVPAATSHLLVFGFPTTIGAGSDGMVTVQAEDAYGNTTPAYRGSVQVTSSDQQATLPALHTFAAGDGGVVQLPVTLKTAGGQSISAADSSITGIHGTESPITVLPGPTSTFVVGYVATTTAGVAHDVGVTAEDTYGNVTPAYEGVVHFSTDDVQADLPADYGFTAADAGQHTFTDGATLRTAGGRTITATDTVSPLTGSAPVQVAPATTSTFFIQYPPTTTAGTPQTLGLTALDPFGNVTPDYAGTVHFSSSDGQATLPADYTFTASDTGTHQFDNVALKTAGEQFIDVADGAAGIDAFTNSGVNPAPTTSLAVAGPLTATTGSSYNFSVTALDSYNNTTPAYAGTVHFASTDADAALPPDATLSSGTGSFAATFQNVGTQSITATDTVHGGITGSQGAIRVIAPVVAHACSGVTDNWTGGGADNLWSDPDNWSAGVPTPTDAACIPSAVTEDIAYDGSGSIVSIDDEGMGGFDISGNSLELTGAGASTINNLSLSGGGVAVDSGHTLSLTGAATVTSGGLTGPGTILISGVMDDSAPEFNNATVQLTGTLVWTAGNLCLDNSSTVEISSGGELDANADDLGIGACSSGTAGPVTVDTGGSLLRNGTAGHVMTVHADLDNNGTVATSPTGGGIDVQGGSTDAGSDSGAWNANGDAITFIGGTRNIDNAATFSGDIVVDGSGLVFPTAGAVNTVPSLHMISGNVSGDLDVTTLTGNGGSVDDGTLTVSSVGDLTGTAFSGSTLVVNGTATWDGLGDLCVNNDASIRIAAGGELDANGDDHAIGACSAGTPGVVTVDAGGSLVRNGTAGHVMTVFAALDDNGTVSTAAAGGGLDVTGGSSASGSDAGAWTANGDPITFTGGTRNIGNTASFTGDIAVDGATVAFPVGEPAVNGVPHLRLMSGNVSGDVNVNDFIGAGGSVNGPGTFTLSGHAVLKGSEFSAASVVVSGTADWQGSNDLCLNNSSNIEIATGGELDANADDLGIGACSSGTPGVVTVDTDGSLVRAGNADHVATVFAALDNNGVVSTVAGAGGLNVEGGSSAAGFDSGEWNANGGAITFTGGTRNIGNTATFTGDIAVDGGGLVFPTGEPVVNAMPSLHLVSGNVSGDVNVTTFTGAGGSVNDGTFTVSSVGDLTGTAFSGATLVVSGTADWEGVQDLCLNNSSNIEIVNGGELDANADDLGIGACSSGTPGVVTVDAGGSLIRNGTADHVSTVFAALDDNGTVSTAAGGGRLDVQGGSSESGADAGAWNANGDPITFTGGARSIGNAATFTGDIAVDGAAVAFPVGAAFVNEVPNLHLIAGTVSGDVNVGGLFTGDGGTVSGPGTFQLSGHADLNGTSFSAASLLITNATQWHQGDLCLDNSSTIDIAGPVGTLQMLLDKSQNIGACSAGTAGAVTIDGGTLFNDNMEGTVVGIYANVTNNGGAMVLKADLDIVGAFTETAAASIEYDVLSTGSGLACPLLQAPGGATVAGTVTMSGEAGNAPSGTTFTILDTLGAGYAGSVMVGSNSYPYTVDDSTNPNVITVTRI